MKKIFIILCTSIFAVSCGGVDNSTEEIKEPEKVLTAKDVEEFIYETDYSFGNIYLDFNSGGVVKKCYKFNEKEFGTDYEYGNWSVEKGNIKIKNLGKYSGVYKPIKSKHGFNVGEILENTDTINDNTFDFICIDYW